MTSEVFFFVLSPLATFLVGYAAGEPKLAAYAVSYVNILWIIYMLLDMMIGGNEEI